jgi:hypothetical protein
MTSWEVLAISSMEAEISDTSLDIFWMLSICFVALSVDFWLEVATCPVALAISSVLLIVSLIV